MDISIFLAKVIGIFCLVMSISMFKRNMIMDVFREVSGRRALSYIIGVWMLIVGLLIISITKWDIITLLGWGILFEALFFLFASKEKASRYLNALENKALYYAIVAAYLILGIYLTLYGFTFFV